MTTDGQQSSGLSYRQSGVDIDSGIELIERIKPVVNRTRRDGVIGSLGGFGALFELPLDRYNNPVLVSSTDGVGTKLKLASMVGQHETIGIDLVAMCVNDIIVTSAEPLYFLDYFATGKLNVNQAEQVISGIAEGCLKAGCALSGGETAEMPGMYSEGEYDLAGFTVGIAEKDRLIDPQNVREGDVVLGLASSGPHSNGYSLIRKIIDTGQHDLNSDFADSNLGRILLAPTRIYVKPLLTLFKSVEVSALAHITGGGLIDNLPRVLPENHCARIDLSAWPRPSIFDWLQKNGRVEEHEMLRTFNCGIGMAVCVRAKDVEAASRILKEQGETLYTIGEIIRCQGEARVEII